VVGAADQEIQLMVIQVDLVVVELDRMVVEDLL
jgi:hypothetical protein